MINILSRLLPRRKAQSPFERATVEDLRYCYRLLLRREPDEAGWKGWCDLVENHKINIQMMVDGFLYSDEFRSLQEEAFRPVLVDLGQFKLYVRKNDFFIGAVIARDKLYEPDVTSEIQKLLGPGDVFVDIGANIGYFTLMAAALVGEQGRVYAFEPNPDNCRLIEDSIAASGFENIRLFPYAVAEAEKTFKLDVGGANSNGRIVDVSPQAGSSSSFSRLIKAVVLDEILKDIGRIDVVKLDIEGAEPRAWQGMQDIIERHRPTLLFEYSPNMIRITSHVEPETLLDQIIARGYDIFALEAPKERNPTPLSKPQIVQRHENSRLTHLDLVAYPH